MAHTYEVIKQQILKTGKNLSYKVFRQITVCVNSLAGGTLLDDCFIHGYILIAVNGFMNVFWRWAISILDSQSHKYRTVLAAIAFVFMETATVYKAVTALWLGCTN